MPRRLSPKEKRFQIRQYLWSQLAGDNSLSAQAVHQQLLVEKSHLARGRSYEATRQLLTRELARRASGEPFATKYKRRSSPSVMTSDVQAQLAAAYQGT